MLFEDFQEKIKISNLAIAAQAAVDGLVKTLAAFFGNSDSLSAGTSSAKVVPGAASDVASEISPPAISKGFSMSTQNQNPKAGLVQV